MNHFFNVKKTTSALFILSLMTTINGCSKAKEILLQQWGEYETKASTLLNPLQKNFTELQQNLNSLSNEKLKNPLIAPLKEKADLALSRFSHDVEESNHIFQSGKEALKAFIEKGKIEEAQKAFTDLKAKCDGALTIASNSYKQAKKEIELLNERIDHPEVLLQDFSRNGGKIDLYTIAFKNNKSELDTKNPESEKTLEDLANFSKYCSDLKFEIISHTSSEGKPAQNKTLTSARAEAVKKAILKKGGQKSSISKAIGKGSESLLFSEPKSGSPEEKAMDKNALEALRNKNRRIEINILMACPPLKVTPESEPAKMPEEKSEEKK